MKTIWRKAGVLATAAFLAAGYGLCEAAVPLSLSKSVEMTLTNTAIRTALPQNSRFIRAAASRTRSRRVITVFPLQT